MIKAYMQTYNCLGSRPIPRRYIIGMRLLVVSPIVLRTVVATPDVFCRHRIPIAPMTNVKTFGVAWVGVAILSCSAVRTYAPRCSASRLCASGVLYSDKPPSRIISDTAESSLWYFRLLEYSCVPFCRRIAWHGIRLHDVVSRHLGMVNNVMFRAVHAATRVS
jgi:hypothetical protein